MRPLAAVALAVCLFAAVTFAQSPPPFPPPTVSPNIPADVTTPFPGVAPNLPYFDDFSWQEFIALTWPAEISTTAPFSRGHPDKSKSYGDLSGPLVFQTWKSDYELFLPGGAAPSAWNSYASPSPCGGNLTPYQTILASFDKYHGFNQAGFGIDAGPLVSQNAQYVRYETRVNMPQYNFIINPPAAYPGPLYLAKNLPGGTSGSPPLQFPIGSIEMKAGWRDLAGVPAAQQQTYFTTKAMLLDPVTGLCSQAVMGLVALHIVNKTTTFPNWVWSTFEHIDNVPAITGETGQGAAPYGFNDNNPANQKLSPMGKPITSCNPPAANPTPTQVVRIRAIAPSTLQTNSMYRNATGVKGTIWANYQLTMTQWPINGGASTFPSTTDPQPQTNTANTVAETWFQSSTATSCMNCHNLSKTKGDDFVWFLPIGAYNPSVTPPPCASVNAFTLANRTLAMQEGVARKKTQRTGREEAIDALRDFMTKNGPKARTNKK